MTSHIFRIVVKSLNEIASKTGLSYNQINILVYYFLIPFSWLCLFDIILNTDYLKIVFVIFVIGFWAGCINFKLYCDRLFNKSVVFLNYFNRFGSNYIASSVWLCVALPIMIYAILIFFAYF
jgi:hypothetical protein